VAYFDTIIHGETVDRFQSTQIDSNLRLTIASLNRYLYSN